jgi:eukaryotic-like serine/threonine-protein kinase
VKPSNLLIDQRTDDDFVWLADFGLARTYQASRLSGLTATGSIDGTLPFMAPEQITHFRDVTPAADQYSAAATLYYYFLTKRFTHDFPKEVAKQLLFVLQEAPQPIQQFCPDLSDKLASVIHPGLARIPSERFADVGEFRRALLGCQK